MRGNKILKSIKLDADALDWQGNSAADGSIKVYDLHELPHKVAIEYLKAIEDLFNDLREKVKHYKKLNEIAELEEKLKKLKDNV